MTIAGAFFYLTACTIKNGLRVRLRRLRQPRYLIVTLVGGLYFFNYVVLFRGVRDEPGGDTRISLGELATRLGVSLELVGCLILLLIVVVAWLLPGRRPALAFSRADIHFLFPAPVTRRQLVQYKLLRSQIGALLGSLFFALILRPGGSSAVGRFWIGLWIVSAALELHLIGVTFARNSLAAHGRRGWAHQRAPVLAVATTIAALAWAIVSAWPALSAMTTAREVFAELERLTSTGVAGVVLWPFNALARLPLATSGAEFVRALPWAAVIIVLNYVWVIRADTAFEEASAEHAEIRANTPPGRRRSVVQKRRAPFRLAASGLPEVALLWKNLILLSRQVTLNLILILIPIVGIAGGLLATDARRAGLAVILAVLCVALAVLLVLTGPFSMRNDLRHDLANLPLLKTWPVRGATLVRGAVLAPTVALSVMITILIVLGAILFGQVEAASVRRAALIHARFVYAGVAILLAPALVLVQIVIQNAFAVLFPAWVTIGPTRGRGGIEAMGQQMVMLFGGLFLLGLALVPAAIATTIAGLAIYALTGTVALLPCAAIATAVIVVECWIATEVLGAVLDRTDVGAIDAPAS